MVRVDERHHFSAEQVLAARCDLLELPDVEQDAALRRARTREQVSVEDMQNP